MEEAMEEDQMDTQMEMIQEETLEIIEVEIEEETEEEIEIEAEEEILVGEMMEIGLPVRVEVMSQSFLEDFPIKPLKMTLKIFAKTMT